MITVSANNLVGSEDSAAAEMTKVLSTSDVETITVDCFKGNADSFIIVEIPANAGGIVYYLSELFGDYAGKAGESAMITLSKGRTNIVRVNSRNVKKTDGTAKFKLYADSHTVDLSDQNIYVGFVNVRNATAY